jgi:hypothetical protein
MASNEKVTIEVTRETRDRMHAVMKTLHTHDLERFLNDLLENIEVTGRKRKVDTYDVVERIFTATCPLKERKVIIAEGERCEYCGEVMEEEGKTVCTYCGSKEIHFLASCPRLKHGAKVVDCSECESGVLDPNRKVVTCRFKE